MALIKFDVLNRFTSAVQFTAEIECAPDAPISIKMGLAVRWAIKTGANLADANLADAYLAGANLADANLARAYLARANLAGANLADAYLARAYLARAYLAGANSCSSLGQPDGWDAWTYCDTNGLQRVRVGCRDFSIAEGREYWADKEDRREVLAALDYAEAIGKIRGWKQS